MTPEQIKEIQRQSLLRVADDKDHGLEYECESDPGWRACETNYNGTACLSTEQMIYAVANNRIRYRIRPDTVNVFGMKLPVMNNFDVRLWVTDSGKGEADAWGKFISDCVSGKYAQKPTRLEDDLPRPHEAYVFCDFEGAPHVCIKNLGNRGNMEKWFEFLDRGLKEGFAKPKKVTAEELVTYLVCSTTHSFEDRAQKIIDLFEGKGE